MSTCCKYSDKNTLAYLRIEALRKMGLGHRPPYFTSSHGISSLVFFSPLSSRLPEMVRSCSYVFTWFIVFWELWFRIPGKRKWGFQEFGWLIFQPIEKPVLKQARIALSQFEPDDSDTKNPPSSWAECQADYISIDPLICPTCDQPVERFRDW